VQSFWGSLLTLFEEFIFFKFDPVLIFFKTEGNFKSALWEAADETGFDSCLPYAFG
jgi:hypothetical protein